MTTPHTAMQLGLTAGLSLVLLGLGSGCTSDAASDAGPGQGTDDGATAGSDGGDVSVECDNLVGEGFAVGPIAENWTSLDADGNPVELYDSCGKVIFYENGAEW